MSENFLRIIPVLPDWMPTEAEANAAAAGVRAMCPNADDVVTRRYTEVTFIDQGGNFERLRCPACTAVLDVAWWREQMDHTFATSCTELSVVTPCCAGAVSLNDLEYDWPAGFTRFEIRARSPGRIWLSSDKAAQMSTLLGIAVRQIFSRY